MEENIKNNEIEQIDTAQEEALQADQMPQLENEDVIAPGEENQAKKQSNVILNKIKALYKKIPKIGWIAAGATLLAAVVTVILVLTLSNTYKTPIKNMEKIYNAKTYKDEITTAKILLNGFAEKEVVEILGSYQKRDGYKDDLEDARDAFEEELEEKIDNYGSNWNATIKIEEKEKLEKEDLKEFRDQLRSLAEQAKDAVEETEGFDSDDWEDFADNMEITKAEAKQLVKSLDALAKKLKKATVSEGYELSCVYIITGDEIDDPEETERTMYVYKVDGRWISSYTISAVFSLMR